MGDLPADSADLTRPPFPCPTPWTCGPNLCTGGCGGDPSLQATEVVYAHADHCETLARQCLALIAALRSTRTAVPGPDQVVVDREALTVLLDLLREKLLCLPLPDVHRTVAFWRNDLDVLADAAAALSPDPSTD